MVQYTGGSVRKGGVEVISEAQARWDAWVIRKPSGNVELFSGELKSPEVDSLEIERMYQFHCKDSSTVILMCINERLSADTVAFFGRSQ